MSCVAPHDVTSLIGSSIIAWRCNDDGDDDDNDDDDDYNDNDNNNKKY